MSKLRIEYIALESLQQAPRNPKDHAPEALSQSVSRFGFVNPLIIDERTGRLVAGHGRLETLQQMRAEGREPPGRVVSKAGSWYVPVLRGVKFDNAAEAEGYSIADNRLPELGGWHEDQLALMLADFAAQGKELLDGTGYDADDVDRMLGGGGDPDKVLANLIRDEKEVQIAKAVVDEIQEVISKRLNDLAENAPDKLAGALGVVVPLKKGSREMFVLADPATKDAIAELRRYAEAGEESPLSLLLESVFPMKP